MTEESCILRLSDAYQSPEAEPELELKVRVLKIAPEANRELLEACQSLRKYMLFVEQDTEVCRIPGAERSSGPGHQ